MKIGKYEISSLDSGTIGLDGGAMFGVVPKKLWKSTNPHDERNRVTLATRLLLMEFGSKKILVDTGTGNNWDEKFTDRYRVDNSESSLETSLAKKNIDKEEITDVILTHLHFDHTGGATKKEGDKFVPAFPNATYHVQAKHLEWALAPSEKDKASFVEDRFIPLLEEGVLNQIDGDALLDEGIELICDHGHTFYQQLVKISDGNSTLFYAADLIPFSAHIALPYVMAYDLMPLETIKQKKKVLSHAVEEDWLIFFQHDPYYTYAKIELTDKGFRAKEKMKEFI